MKIQYSHKETSFWKRKVKYSKYILEKLAYSGEDKLKRQEGDQQTDEEMSVGDLSVWWFNPT